MNSFTGQTFAEVQNAFCRLIDETNGQELARYALRGGGPYTAQIMAKVHREGGAGGAWQMSAIGAPATGRTRTFQDLLPVLSSHLRDGLWRVSRRPRENLRVTERKPPGISFETWADRQIREAEERGAFANLPGKGKPLPNLDKPYDDLWWVKEKMARENLSFLPPTLVLRKEAEDALAAVEKAPSERVVREILSEVNDKIREAIRRPPPGPPLHLTPFDIDEVVREWREHRGRIEHDEDRPG